ncbi:MAG: phospholipid carrier-dependent glycosyltransferase, partial [bacterium]|nr:phospholipid carrier-dependent glycosyltransferase [bacterium]
MSTNKKIIILILALSALTHFAFFGHPNQTVFDEVHFGKFISGYFTGEYFFDIHPPLGKLLISGMGYLTGFQPGFSFANIGETFPDQYYLLLRALPALAGLLLPLIIFLLARELNFSPRSSLLAALLVIFENALIVQSRFILLDSFLLLFGFSSLLFYFKYRNSPLIHIPGWTWDVDKLRWLILAGISAGLAASVKWTGLAFLGIILVLELINQVRLSSNKNRPETKWGQFLRKPADKNYVHRGLSRLLLSFSCLIFIPLTIY